MSIKKLEEFAKLGDKSLSGLSLTTGFPVRQKPFRQWFNWILNDITKKANELVDAVNINRTDIDTNKTDITALDTKFTPLFEPIEVGELFITTNDYQSPQDVRDRHGYGTWARYSEGRTLVGYSNKTLDPASYKTMANEFGANTHQLTIPEIPSHTHNIDFRKGNIGGSTRSATDNTSSSAANLTTESAGGGLAHNNIQPSIVVGFWLRVA